MKKFLSVTFILTTFCTVSMAQDLQADILLVKNKNFVSASDLLYYKRAGNDTKVLETKKENIVAAYNPLSLVLKGGMLFYQRVLSPQLARNCPYEITCSNFSKQAIHHYGIIKGISLSADRLMRCTRIGILDVHPLDFNTATGTITDSLNRYQ